MNGYSFCSNGHKYKHTDEIRPGRIQSINMAANKQPPMGYCPECGERTTSAEKRLDGYVWCSAGHKYKLSDAVHEEKVSDPVFQMTGRIASCEQQWECPICLCTGSVTSNGWTECNTCHSKFPEEISKQRPKEMLLRGQISMMGTSNGALSAQIRDKDSLIRKLINSNHYLKLELNEAKQSHWDLERRSTWQCPDCRATNMGFDDCECGQSVVPQNRKDHFKIGGIHA